MVNGDGRREKPETRDQTTTEDGGRRTTDDRLGLANYGIRNPPQVAYPQVGTHLWAGTPSEEASRPLGFLETLRGHLKIPVW
jgi:hypothetical protein